MKKSLGENFGPFFRGQESFNLYISATKLSLIKLEAEYSSTTLALSLKNRILFNFKQYTSNNKYSLEFQLQFFQPHYFWINFAFVVKRSPC
jgi:hypothetical protein